MLLYLSVFTRKLQIIYTYVHLYTGILHSQIKVFQIFPHTLVFKIMGILEKIDNIPKYFKVIQ